MIKTRAVMMRNTMKFGVSAAVAMRERERTQNHAEGVKSNSCDQADRRVNDMADPDCSYDACQDRYQEGKMDREVVDDVVGFVLHSEEGEIKGRL